MLNIIGKEEKVDTMKPLKRLSLIRRVSWIFFIFIIIVSVQIVTVEATIGFWIAKEKMLTARGQAVVIEGDGLIFVIGGIDGNDAIPLSRMEIYDHEMNSWSTGAPLPNATRGAAGAKGLDGTVYVISGAGPGRNSVQAYNPTTNTWTVKTDIPYSVWAADATTGEDGNIYVIGGSGGRDLVQVYNPLSDSWSLGSTMPTPRIGLGVITSEDGLVYAVGGYSLDEQKALSTVEVYNPVTDSWVIKPALPNSLCQFGITLGPLGRIYVLGGSTDYLNNTGPFSPTVYSFNTATNIWQNEDPMPTRRSELGAVTIGNRIFAIGGANGDYLDVNEVAIVPDGVFPQANAGLDDDVGQGELIYFNGSRSTDNIGIANYTWVFSDITPQNLMGVAPSYIFDTVGIYHIMLNVTDWGGNWATDNVTITVTDTEGPVVDANCNGNRIPSDSGFVTYRVEPGTAVIYDARDSSDNVDSIEDLQFEWSFGDNSEKSKDMTVSYTHIPLPIPFYSYHVTLRVEDLSGNVGTETIEIHFLDKEASVISCSASPTNIVLGNAISISGSLTPSTKDVNVTIIYTTPQIYGGQTLHREVSVSPNGGFNDTFTPNSVGSWFVRAYWEGNVTVQSSTSAEISFIVSKNSSSISCASSSLTVNEGETITIFGNTIPNIPDAFISLHYIKPEGTEVNRTAQTNVNGAYSDNYTPLERGVWEVRASWKGDETMEGAVSSEVSFTVIGAFRFPIETLVSSIVIVLFLISVHFSKSITRYISKLKTKV
jgi:N-acetylneuraminic acid mutarotase